MATEIRMTLYTEKDLIQQEDTKIISMYTHNIFETKGDRREKLIVVNNRDFTIPLSITDRRTRDNINRKEYLNDAIIQLELTNIYKTIHPTIMDYTSVHRTLSRVEHMLGHKTNLKKF